MAPSIFSETVYDDEPSKYPSHMRFNLAVILDFIFHPKSAQYVMLPLVVTSVLFSLWALVSLPTAWLFGLWFPLVFWLLASVFKLVAIVFQHKAHHANEKRWKPWHDEVAIVTGGSNGIGWEFAKRLAAKGVKVAIWDLAAPKSDLPNNIKFWKCDVSNPEIVYAMHKQVEKDLGIVTILINNAGIVQAKSLTSLSEQEITKTFQVNTLAHFWTCKAVLPRMKEERYGHIVTIASTMGLTAVADMTDYCASKFAAVGFHESLRQEIKRLPFPHLIHTSLICPGLILTGMFHGIKIKTPFLTPPLNPSQVGDIVMECIESCVQISRGSDKTKTVEQALRETPHTLSDEIRQHKTVWAPSTYILPQLLSLLTPVWFVDKVKDVLGGNSAITDSFKGRNTKERPRDQ